MAMDTPEALKQTKIKGPAWNIVTSPLIPALESLTTTHGVHRAGLLGDHLHAITDRGAHTIETRCRRVSRAWFCKCACGRNRADTGRCVY